MEDLCDLYRNASKQGNSMAWPAQRTHFWDTFPPAPMSNVTPESTKKLYCFWSDHTSFSTILYDFAHNPTPKQTANKAETAWPGRPTRSIFEPHFIPRPCRTSRLNPVKNHKVVVRYCWLWQACQSCWNKTLQNRKTAWPGRLFRTTFHPPPVSNVASECIKKSLVIVFWYDNASCGRLVEAV